MPIPSQNVKKLAFFNVKYTHYCSFHGNDLRGEIKGKKLRPCGIQSLRGPDHLQRVINNFFIVLLGRKISLVIFLSLLAEVMVTD